MDLKKWTDEYDYDVFLSIGPHCRPAIHLRSNQLRDFAAPLDWMGDYSLDTVIHLFRDGFKDFFPEYTTPHDSFQPSQI